MVKTIHTVILSICILLWSCHHENEQLYPEEFKVIVDAFFEEANIRGHDLQQSHYDFEIKLGETPGENVLGSCQQNGHVITINEEEWPMLTDREKEWVLFHELGHCILGRGHMNAESLTGECYSYMKGAENDFECSINYYSEYWREYYMDELFDDKAMLPAWYLDNQDFSKSDISFPNSLVVIDTSIEILEVDTFKFSRHDTFLFEIEFYNSDSPPQIVEVSLGNLKFSYCDHCTFAKTHLSLDNHLFYSSGDIDLNTDVKLSIFRNHDIVSFYINEYFVHAMEYSIIKGGRVKTNIFSDNMQLSLNYQYN